MSKEDEPNSFKSLVNYNGDLVNLDIIYFNTQHVNVITLDTFINLDIEENIQSPFYSGLLTIKNENNSFDTMKSIPLPESDILNIDFLETGENYIYVKFQTDYITKEYVFNISKEFETVEKNTKAKNFVLIDYHLWYMMYSKANFSSTFILEGDTTQLSDKDRMSNTSDSIKKLLIDNVDKGCIDENYWTKSNTDSFYSSNYQDSILVALNKLLESTLDNNDDSMLLLKRKNKYGLYSLSKMYNNFISNNYYDNYGGTFSLGTDLGNPETNLTLNSIKVNNFSLLNENGKNTLENLTNYKVFNYDYRGKKFNIYNEQNTIEKTVEHIEDTYLNKKTHINRSANNNITKNRYYQTYYSTEINDNITSIEGRQEILKNMMKYTTALNLKTEGLLSIDTGNFIIVSHDPIKINKNLRKLNGGWFVYGLRHSFSVKDFRTEIACTKFYEIKKDE